MNNIFYNLIFLVSVNFTGYVDGVDITLPVHERSRRDATSSNDKLSVVCQSALNEKAKQNIEKNMV